MTPPLPRAYEGVCTPTLRQSRTFCARSSTPQLTIGPAATDTFGGWIPDGQTLSPFDTSNPALAQLDPALLNAVLDAARADIAGQFVVSPDVSKHVVGQAVDVAPVDADKWLIRSGAQFGLCQIYANEIWHFELAVDEQATARR